jgi:hypothetical protein
VVTDHLTLLAQQTSARRALFFGGEAAADAEAQSKAWRRSIEFLRANL